MRRSIISLFAASLFALVASSPLGDTNANQLTLVVPNQGDQCSTKGTLCDWPAGSRGPCCVGLLCIPMTTDPTPYSVCA
ncbi:hypothetical protein HYDPIDRAFT_115934 [Hydnomerulius pinastri MD-312]|uniref:Hydrophobin n=1 Tax=Hydnomerulius pinastri MD-312 TaxID=994086 RepID=A0A0C9V736_9AGAM|nr:hypothetical protein HYDPIDRAFT_115934 [Hydnomerulius pinastri MD-312]